MSLNLITKFETELDYHRSRSSSKSVYAAQRADSNLELAKFVTGLQLPHPVSKIDPDLNHLVFKVLPGEAQGPYIAATESIVSLSALRKRELLGHKICHFAQDVVSVAYGKRVANERAFEQLKADDSLMAKYPDLRTAVRNSSSVSRLFKQYPQNCTDFIKCTRSYYRNTKDVRRRRYMVFDLDLPSRETGFNFQALWEQLQRLEIAHWVATIVESSPNNFHVYIRIPEIVYAEQNAHAPTYGRWEELLEAAWHTINLALNGDPTAFHRLRVLQTPGFRNPKRNFLARVVYYQESAPLVLWQDFLRFVPPTAWEEAPKPTPTPKPIRQLIEPEAIAPMDLLPDLPLESLLKKVPEYKHLLSYGKASTNQDLLMLGRYAHRYGSLTSEATILQVLHLCSEYFTTYYPPSDFPDNLDRRVRSLLAKSLKTQVHKGESTANQTHRHWVRAVQLAYPETHGESWKIFFAALGYAQFGTHQSPLNSQDHWARVPIAKLRNVPGVGRVQPKIRKLEEWGVLQRSAHYAAIQNLQDPENFKGQTRIWLFQLPTKRKMTATSTAPPTPLFGAYVQHTVNSRQSGFYFNTTLRSFPIQTHIVNGHLKKPHTIENLTSKPENLIMFGESWLGRPVNMWTQDELEWVMNVNCVDSVDYVDQVKGDGMVKASIPPIFWKQVEPHPHHTNKKKWKRIEKIIGNDPLLLINADPPLPIGLH
jgi:hypothetical protein